MLDPQELSFAGKLRALTAMGRIPLASEVPAWTLLGCVLSSQIFDSRRASLATGEDSIFRTFDWKTTLSCMFITWASNISINYGNEYFDWNVDRPSQVAAIKKDVQERRDAIAFVKESVKNGSNGNAKGYQKKNPETVMEDVMKTKGEMMTKISGNTTRIIHDGTFPPHTALVCGAAWQLAVLTVVVASRIFSDSSPFRGLTLQIIAVGTFFSQEYVAPPFRFHYHGLGEITSSLLMVPVDILFGLTAHYTASNDLPLHLRDLFLLLDSQVWTFILAVYLFSQARILVMHIPDIQGDIRGGKLTLCTRIGHTASTHLYGMLNLGCIAAFASLIAQLYTDTEGKGLLDRVAGGLPLLTQDGLQAHRNAFVLGLGVVATYYLPIAATVYKSLLAAAPSSKQVKKEGKEGVLPTLHPTTCAIIVSLQLLTTPWILSGTVLLAARAGLSRG